MSSQAHTLRPTLTAQRSTLSTSVSVQKGVQECFLRSFVPAVIRLYATRINFAQCCTTTFLHRVIRNIRAYLDIFCAMFTHNRISALTSVPGYIIVYTVYSLLLGTFVQLFYSNFSATVYCLSYIPYCLLSAAITLEFSHLGFTKSLNLLLIAVFLTFFQLFTPVRFHFKATF